jgi:hypothetical protein
MKLCRLRCGPQLGPANGTPPSARGSIGRPGRVPAVLSTRANVLPVPAGSPASPC